MKNLTKLALLSVLLLATTTPIAAVSVWGANMYSTSWSPTVVCDSCDSINNAKVDEAGALAAYTTCARLKGEDSCKAEYDKYQFALKTRWAAEQIPVITPKGKHSS